MVGKWTNEPCSGVDEVVNHFWVLTSAREIFYVCMYVCSCTRVIACNMFYVFKFHASALYVCMFMFMGLDARMI